jgi:hypothetical protein
MISVRHIPGACACLTLLLTTGSRAESFDANFPEPASDRWNYGFNTTTGSRPVASVFGYTGTLYEFDDRDGQIVLDFDTTALVPADAGSDRYRIDSIVLEITLADLLSGGYDASIDDWRTHLPPDHPEYLVDEDPGRPIELFATGFRNGISPATWTETTDFSPVGPFGEGVRNAFAAECLAAGGLRDVSNSVADGFTPTPLAVGIAKGSMPGVELAEGTVLRFEFDGGDPVVADWLGTSLDAGRLLFSVSSLVEAEQQGGDFVDLYMRENPLVVAGVRNAATLRITGEITDGCSVPGDLDGDCIVGGGDLGIFLASWGTNDPATDFNQDQMTNGIDLGILLSLF